MSNMSIEVKPVGVSVQLLLSTGHGPVAQAELTTEQAAQLEDLLLSARLEVWRNVADSVAALAGEGPL